MFTLDDIYSSSDWSSLGEDDQDSVLSAYHDTYGDEINSLWDNISSDEAFSTLKEDDQVKVRDKFTSLYGVAPILPFERDKDNAFERGMSSLGFGIDYAKAMTTGDTDAAAKATSDYLEYQQKNPGSVEGNELMTAWNADPTVMGGVSNVIDEISNDYNAADGAIEGAKSLWANVKAMGEGLAEQAPNMIAPLIGNLVGGLGGAAAGSAIPVVGTTAGGITGTLAGGTAGNMLVEGLPMAIESMVNDGVNLNDTAAVSSYLDDNYGDLFKESGIKGAVLSAVDLVTMKAGHSILKAMPSGGISNIVRNSLAAATEPAGEFAGEYLGTGLATGDYNTKEAALEAVSSLGQSGVTFAGQKVYEAFSTKATEEIDTAKAEVIDEAKLLASDFTDADNIDDLLEAHSGIKAAEDKLAKLDGIKAEVKTALDATVSSQMEQIVSAMEKETPAATTEPPTTEPAAESTTFTKTSGEPFTSEKSLAASASSRGVDLTGYDVVETAPNAWVATPKKNELLASVAETTSNAGDPDEGNQESSAEVVSSSTPAQSSASPEQKETSSSVATVTTPLLQVTSPFTAKSGTPFKTAKSLVAAAKSQGVDLAEYDVVETAPSAWVATRKLLTNTADVTDGNPVSDAPAPTELGTVSEMETVATTQPATVETQAETKISEPVVLDTEAPAPIADLPSEAALDGLAVAQQNNVFTGNRSDAGRRTGYTQPKGTPVEKLFSNFAYSENDAKPSVSSKFRKDMFDRANKTPARFATDKISTSTDTLGEYDIKVDAAAKGDTRVQVLNKSGAVVAVARLEKGMIDAIATRDIDRGKNIGEKLLEYIDQKGIGNIDEVPDRSPGFVKIQKKVVSKRANNTAPASDTSAPQGVTPEPATKKMYSVTDGTENESADVTRETVAKAFPGSTVTDGASGHIVSLPNGRVIVVNTNAEIDFDRAKAESALGRKLTSTEVPQGAFLPIGQDGLIQLAKVNAEGTLSHEMFHAAEEMVLTRDEISIVAAKYGSAEARAEAYRAWDGKSNKIFEKIKNFFSRMLDAFYPNSRAVFSKIKSGEVWSRGTEVGNGVWDSNGSLSVDYSVRTAEETLATLSAYNKKHNITDPATMKKYAADIRSVSAMILGDPSNGISARPDLDYIAADQYSSVKKNSDKHYVLSVDFSTICKKRIVLAATIESLQKRLGRGLTPDEIGTVRATLQSHKIVVSCGACYVDAARVGYGRALNRFLNYNKKHEHLRDKFLTQSGMDILAAENPEVYNQFLKYIRPQLIKVSESRTEYKQEILNTKVISDGLVDKFNSRSGMRWQSWSDFELHHLIDAMQAISHMNARGMLGHTYTKVTDMVRALGRTGMMINGSLIPNGSGISNGKLDFSSVEGMDYAEMVNLRKEFPETFGSIAIGVSDQHIRMLMADKTIDYIIPYHVSGLPMSIRQREGFDIWADYTRYQNETVADADLLKKNGTMSEFKEWSGAISSWWDSNLTGDENAKVYLDKCKAWGITPKFEQFANESGYWKMLTDRKMYNNDGQGIIQGPVRPEYDMDVLRTMINEYVPDSKEAHGPTVEELSSVFPSVMPDSEMMTGEQLSLLPNDEIAGMKPGGMTKSQERAFLSINQKVIKGLIGRKMVSEGTPIKGLGEYLPSHKYLFGIDKMNNGFAGRVDNLVALIRKYEPMSKEDLISKLDDITNNGIDAASQDIQYSIAPFTSAVSKAKAYAESKGVTGLLENELERWFDADYKIEKAQKMMGEQDESRDAILMRRLQGKKIANRNEEFKDEELSPYIKKIAKAKLTHEDVNEYAHAQHAPERNAQMKRVNARSYADNVLKMMTEKEGEPWKERLAQIADDAVMNSTPVNDMRDQVVTLAEDLFSEYDQRVAATDARQAKLDARVFTQEEIDKGTPEYIQKLIDSARKRLAFQKKTIDLWNDVNDRLSGMTNDDSSDIIAKWKADSRASDIEAAATTLRRWSAENLAINHEAGELTDEEYEAIKSTYEFHIPLNREGEESSYQVGKTGVGPLARPIKAATGSTKKVDTIVGHVVSRRQNAISRSERLAAGRVMYDMIVEHNDPDFFTVDTPKTRKLPDSEGNIRIVPDHTWNKETEILVKVDGKTHTITANKDNPHAMAFVKAVNRDPISLGPIMRTSQKLVRIMAMLNTTLNPEFLVTNFVRDIPTALINMTDSEAKGMQLKVLKGIPAAWKAINSAESGKTSGAMGAMYKRFKSSGSKIGWMQTHEKIEDLANELNRDLEIASGKHQFIAKRNKVLKVVERLNTATENAIRLATFKELVESGVSDAKAAYAVSNLTVDFTRHGTAGPSINALFMFANAGLQSNYRMTVALIRSKKARQSAMGIVGLGFALNIMGAMAGGDDDDGNSRLDNLKKSRGDLFDRNMVIMIPGLDEPVKIPLPYGYNLFHILGDAIGDLVRGKSGVIEAFGRLETAMINVFSPMQGGTIIQALAPTIIDPIAMAEENKSWFGGDLAPSPMPWESKNKPESSRYWSDVNPIAKQVTTWLNELGGGSEFRKSKIEFLDISPETVEMMVETYTGSAGKFVKDVLGLAAMPFSDQDVEVSQIPFVRKVYGGSSDSQDSSIFRQNIDEVKTLLSEEKDATGTDKAEYRSDPLYQLKGITKTTESLVRKTKKNMREAEERGDDATAERQKERLNEIYSKFNKRYNEVAE